MDRDGVVAKSDLEREPSVSTHGQQGILGQYSEDSLELVLDLDAVLLRYHLHQEVVADVLVGEDHSGRPRGFQKQVQRYLSLQTCLMLTLHQETPHRLSCDGSLLADHGWPAQSLFPDGPV